MKQKCRVCDGQGRITTLVGPERRKIEVPCPTCNGAGIINGGLKS